MGVSKPKDFVEKAKEEEPITVYNNTYPAIVESIEARTGMRGEVTQVIVEF